MLPDGSRISSEHINASSAPDSRVPPGESPRSGVKRYSSVQHDARRPFEVSPATHKRVRGTIFNILYLNNRTGISVLEGRIVSRRLRIG